MEAPLVVLAGRTNVGKSTLFNRIVGRREALVLNAPHLTRDTLVKRLNFEGRPFLLADTPGFAPKTEGTLEEAVQKGVKRLFQQAERIVLVLDGRAPLDAEDLELVRFLRGLGKRVVVFVNKIDFGMPGQLDTAGYELGFPEVMYGSAEHNVGIYDLLEAVCLGFPKDEAAPAPTKALPRVAILGPQNAGKSTLFNALVGAERAVVSDVPGTTRDAIEELEPSGAFRAVDTAGLKRKAKSDVFEKLSGIKAIGTLEHADVALLVADATTPPTRQELRVARYVFAHKKPLVVALNKSDLLTLSLEEKADLVRSWQGIFNLFPGAYVLLVSALEKKNLAALRSALIKAHEAASKRISTGVLNREVQKMLRGGLEAFNAKKGNPMYITQVSTNPPRFTVFLGRGANRETFPLKHFVSLLSATFDMPGVPIEIDLRIKS